MNLPPQKRCNQKALGSASLDSGSGGFIPDDILFFQILILLPVKCLVRLQSVCKLWRTTLTSNYFARHHLELSRPKPSMVVMPRMYLEDPKRLSLQGVTFYRFRPGQSQVAKLILDKNCPNGIPTFSKPLHCDGLILIPCTTGRIFMCNPMTREFVELPQGSRNIAGDHRVAFGYDPLSGKYKVARHFFRSYTEKPQEDGEGTIIKYSAGHEVLTLGDGEEAWRWKATMDPPYAINARTPICLPGFFYWSALHSLTNHDDIKVCSHVILRFNLHDEMFTVHPNPPCRGFLSKNDMLGELDGKLCYIHSDSLFDVAIWVAEDGPNLAWSLRCNIDLMPVVRRLAVSACASPEQEKIFLSVDAWYLLKCDLRDGSVEKIINMANVLYDNGDGVRFSTDTRPVAHYVLPFVESLLRIRPG